jgi:hypothetical protein
MGVSFTFKLENFKLDQPAVSRLILRSPQVSQELARVGSSVNSAGNWQPAIGTKRARATDKRKASEKLLATSNPELRRRGHILEFYGK